MGVINHPQDLAGRLLDSGTFHDPKNHPTSGFSSVVCTTVKMMVGLFNQQK
jgi:hypothetical protein